MKLCLTIGVSNAKPLSNLPGAIIAAKEIGLWAQQAGFLTEVITDEDNTPVTIERVRKTLLKMLPANDEVDLFILHFAGHGLRSGAEQNIWLTSDWHHEMRAISVEALRRRLYMYGVKSLSIFADACRSLPSDIDTANICEDAVLPRGPHESVLPAIARFNAVGEGQQAYMLKGDSIAPSRCVFSTVLVEGLSGAKDDAFDKYLQNCIIPESLALFSQKRLTEIAEIYDLKFSPEFNTGIPRDHAIYLKREESSKTLPQLPKWPAPPSFSEVQNKFSEEPPEFLADRSNDAQVILPDAMYSLKQSRSGKSSKGFKQHYIDEIFQGGYFSKSDSNLIVRGAVPKNIWSTCQVDVRSINKRGGSYLVSDTIKNVFQILIEFFDGVFASAVVYENLTTIVSRDGKNEINWTCVSPWELDWIGSDLSMIEKLQKGTLSAKKVDSIAAKLRRSTHVNPTLGAIASYLYDFTGDLDSIHRMAFLYCNNSQPMPFDVSFLGALSMKEIEGGQIEVKVPPVVSRPRSLLNDRLPYWVTMKTSEQSGLVAGLWPWLRQGWVFVDEPEPQERTHTGGLNGIAKFLLPSQFSSFTEKGARILIERFNMESNK